MTLLPPSSPVAVDSFQSDPFEYPSVNNASKNAKSSTVELPQDERWYPTPDPSSSLGRSSSPIRGATVRTSSPAPHRNLISHPKPVMIELDPRDPSRLAIGRKQSVCDIVLPNRKSISRQHAFISYVADKNQVNLECNGANGCIVVLPGQMECQLLMKPSATRAVFELRNKGDEDNTEYALHDRELVTDHLLTSFVLLKGEMATIPYVKGTILDFRQAEAVLILKQLDCSWREDDENVTETEDEMVAIVTKSDDFNRVNSTPTKFATVERSPATLRLSQRQKIKDSKLAVQVNLQSPLSHKGSTVEGTPTSSPIIQALSTPAKPKKLDLLLDNQIQNRESPLDNRSGEPPRRRNWNTAFSKDPKNILKSKKKSASYRRVHETATGPEMTPGALVHSMEQRGIECVELQRVLTNHLAFANVLQTPLSQLQTVNSTISTLSREELRALLAEEHCIGVIHRQGKDAAGKPLDEEYFYDVENDDDLERRNLVFTFKGGRSGLRSCRKVHKQYFWKKPAK